MCPLILSLAICTLVPGTRLESRGASPHSTAASTATTGRTLTVNMVDDAKAGPRTEADSAVSEQRRAPVLSRIL